MPGTYPRSSNPYFPFDRMQEIERELHRFHNLKASYSYKEWALSTVYTSFNDAVSVAETLNTMLPPDVKGRYVVVPANETLLWFRRDDNGQATGHIIAWSAPVASSGYIIVFVPDDEVVMTLSEYEHKFKFPPILLKEERIQANLIKRYIKNVKPLEKLARGFPVSGQFQSHATCFVCGEPKAYCRCGTYHDSN